MLTALCVFGHSMPVARVLYREATLKRAVLLIVPMPDLSSCAINSISSVTALQCPGLVRDGSFVRFSKRADVPTGCARRCGMRLPPVSGLGCPSKLAPWSFPTRRTNANDFCHEIRDTELQSTPGRRYETVPCGRRSYWRRGQRC